MKGQNKMVSRNAAEVAHPGRILVREFMRPMGLTVEQLACELGLTVQRLEQIVRGERRITYMTALRLCGYFGTTPEFWLTLQERYDATQSQVDLVILSEESEANGVERRRPSLPCTGIGPGMESSSIRQFFQSLAKVPTSLLTII